MPLYIYSPESLPNSTLMKTPRNGYTPEYITYSGIVFPVVAGQWTKFPSHYRVTRHSDFKDHGHLESVSAEDALERLRAQWGERGITFLTHEPNREEKMAAEKVGSERNLEFRKNVVRAYEAGVREREITGSGRSTPTPYEDECYELLALPKPYSVEAFRAQRLPGEDVANRLANSLEDVVKRLGAPQATHGGLQGARG